MGLPDEELSLEEIELLQAEPESSSSRKPREKKLQERNVENWFKAVHTGSRNCEVPSHDESRPRNKGMTTIINDVAVCRVCFLSELDKQ